MGRGGGTREGRVGWRSVCVCPGMGWGLGVGGLERGRKE